MIGVHRLFRLTGNKALGAQIQQFFQVLEKYQLADGYIGPWPSDGQFPVNEWDAWGHYHILLASVLWYQATGHQPTLVRPARVPLKVYCVAWHVPLTVHCFAWHVCIALHAATNLRMGKRTLDLALPHCPTPPLTRLLWVAVVLHPHCTGVRGENSRHACGQCLFLGRI